MNYQNPCSRWPRHDGYREVERIADVALMPADEVPNTSVEWLWPNTVPIGHLTLVAGEPGTGKSFWMADLAARVSFARPWPYADRQCEGPDAGGTATPQHNAGGTPTPRIQNPKAIIQSQNGCAIIVNSDDGFVDVQQPRLAAAVANMPNVGLMRRLPPGSRFSQMHSVGPVTDRLQALKSAVKEAGDCRLVIVDDLARFVRTGSGKVTRADLLLALDSLKCIAGECNVAMVVVWRLERTGRATAKYLETFLPASAMAWLVGCDPYRDGLRWAVPLKNHFGPLGEPLAFSIEQTSVVWLRPPDVVPADVTAAFLRKSDRRLEREQAGKWALARLGEGPVEARMLFEDAAAFGFRERTLRRALGDLGLKPTKCGNDGPWLWWLGGPQAAAHMEPAEMADCESEEGRPLSVASGPLPRTTDNEPLTPPTIQKPESKMQNQTTEGHPPDTHLEDCQLAPQGAPQCAPRAPSLTGHVVEAMCDEDGRVTALFVADDEPKAGGNFEDCQLAQERKQVTGDREQADEKSQIANCELQIGNREEAEIAEPPIQDPESKLQNPSSDDFDETDVGLTADDKITIVVVHPSAPGAEVSAAAATAHAQPP